jgi:hypothetical protein
MGLRIEVVHIGGLVEIDRVVWILGIEWMSKIEWVVEWGWWEAELLKMEVALIFHKLLIEIFLLIDDGRDGIE